MLFFKNAIQPQIHHSDDNYFKTHFQRSPAATTEHDISNWWKVKG
jgi:hypothetical protein